MFAEAGLDPETPPKTPEAFLAASEALKNAGISPIVTGMSPNVMWDWLARVLVANAYPGGSAQQWSTGEANFDDAPFVRAVEFIDTLRENEYFHPDSYDIPVFMDALELFKSGEGAIFIGLLSDIAHWKDFADARGEGNIGYFPTINFPSDSVEDRQVLNGAGLGYSITTWSDAKDAAAAYLEFYGREGAPILLESVGALHPNQSVDASSLGYPILGDVLSYLSNGTASIDSYVPNAAWDLAIRQLSQSWLIGELTAQEYIEQSQRILEAERDNL